jgi:hypothetical protein
MTLIRIPAVGQLGVNKDLSQHELPPNIWTDANNVRFIDGTAQQVLGYSDLYPSPSVIPYHVMPLNVAGVRTWIYAGATKIYTVINGPTHTDISRAVGGAYSATRNSWTSCLIGGIPILNNGVDAPQQWLLTGTCTALTNWPANTTAQSIRTFKNSLIALNITKAGVNYPFMVKWSHPADPGSVPPTWDTADATKDAGESDLSDGYDKIVDGLTLRDSFMIYKETSVWRMDYVGGTFVYRFQKVLGASGALTKNCIAEIDGIHFVLSASDCVVHDGQTATSVLDKQTRRYLFQQIDPTYSNQCFVFVNRLYNEVFVCYPSAGNTTCNKAMVWNTVDKSISFRDMPNINHGASGAVDDTSGNTYASTSLTYDTAINVYDANQSSLTRALSVVAADGQKLYLLDQGLTFAGSTISSYIERQGLSLGDPEGMKLVTRIRPRIYGTNGATVAVSVGSQVDPYGAITYNTPVNFTIGSSVSIDTLCSARYLALKFATGTATQWRLDSYDIEVEEVGMW